MSAICEENSSVRLNWSWPLFCVDDDSLDQLLSAIGVAIMLLASLGLSLSAMKCQGQSRFRTVLIGQVLIGVCAALLLLTSADAAYCVLAGCAVAVGFASRCQMSDRKYAGSK